VGRVTVRLIDTASAPTGISQWPTMAKARVSGSVTPAGAATVAVLLRLPVAAASIAPVRV